MRFDFAFDDIDIGRFKSMIGNEWIPKATTFVKIEMMFVNSTN